MRTAKIAITLNWNLLVRLDKLIQAFRFPSRSRVVQVALREKLDRLDRLARECAKLDPSFEQNMAEDGLIAEANNYSPRGAPKHSTSRCHTTTR